MVNEDMSLKDVIISDLTGAMKAKDASRLSTLRMVKANLMNRQIEKGSDLTDEEIIKALQALVKQRRDSVEQYEKAGRANSPKKEQTEIPLSTLLAAKRESSETSAPSRKLSKKPARLQ